MPKRNASLYPPAVQDLIAEKSAVLSKAGGDSPARRNRMHLTQAQRKALVAIPEGRPSHQAAGC